MRQARTTGAWIGVLAATSLAASAGAVDDVITFDEVPVGTAIDGVTLLGYATFDTQTQAFPSPTVEVEGTPEDGAFGEGAFLIGTFGDFITIDLAIPVTRVSVAFSLDDTIHSSVQMHLQGSDGKAPGGVFVQGFPIATDTWPAVMSDSVSGFASFETEEPVTQIGMSFAAGAFATMFAIDNIELSTVSCNGADVAEPFGELDFSDVAAFLQLFSEGNPLADLAAPTGQIDFGDVVSFLGQFGVGCP